MPQNKKIQTKIPIYTPVAIVILLVFIGLLVAYYYQNTALTSLHQNYTGLKSHYNTTLQVLNSTLQNRNSLQQNYTSLGVKYNNLNVTYQATYRNLTIPYTKTFYMNYNVQIPKENVSYVWGYNFTTSQYYPIYKFVPGTYNFSLYFPYPGYITLTYSTTSFQSTLYSNFSFYTSQEQPFNNNGLVFSRYVSPYTTYAGPGNAQAVIPVLNGTNYFILYNTNYKNGIGVTFTLQYVGYHTK